MRPTKRRKIGVLSTPRRGETTVGTSESEQETRATVVEEGNEIIIKFGGDTEDELEDDIDEDQNYEDSSPLTTRVLIR